MNVACYECCAKFKTWVRHPWPPCDLDAMGNAINPLPCGHRRICADEQGECKECKREAKKIATSSQHI